MKKILVYSTVLVIASLVVAGCGGGRGSNRALSGTVTDIAGNLVPGAEIFVDDQSRAATTSLMNGTYKIPDLSAGEHNVEAVAFVAGKRWMGTRVVNVYADGPTQNMNLVIGPFDEVGTIQGSVTDLSNNPLPNARVIAVARYPQDRPADEASVISKVAITDRNGEYVLTDMPATISVNQVKQDIIYDVIASFAGASGQPRGFENQTKTATVAPGAVTFVNFTLQSSTNELPPVPPGWTDPGAIDVIAYTVPEVITTRAKADAYDAVKSCISEKSRKVVALRRRIAKRSPPLGTLIEDNVIWYYIWTSYFGIDVPNNLAGFTIYRGTTPNLEKTDRFRLDFFRDPAIVTYADASRELSARVTYWYGVTSVSTSYLDANDRFNPLAESEMSAVASVTPLDQLRVFLPADGGEVSVTHAMFSWSPVFGARSYRVFIYDDYPVVDSMFTPQGDPERPDHLPAWGQSAVTADTSVIFSDPNFTLQPGHTYWWVAMAADDDDFDAATAYAISELRSFTAR